MRFKISGVADEIGVSLEECRIYTHEVADYEEALPAFLFKICQPARDLRMKSLV